MTKHLVLHLFILVWFCVLAVYPKPLGGKSPGDRTSRLWCRLIGISGAIWVVLFLLTDRQLALFPISATTDAKIAFVRHLLAGTMVGLLIAVFTHRCWRQ